MATLQNFLRTIGSVLDLQKRYNINVKLHDSYPQLHLFKYDQRKSPFNEPIVRECRGIILDADNDWAIVCRPYDKFFNYEEPEAHDIDWSTARCYEKLDGSLMTLYHYDDKWHVSSSGVPDASGNLPPTVYKSDMTFRDLFWQVWGELNYQLPEDTSKCYIFELMTPLNQVIVPQKSNQIILHGVRCMETMAEHTPESYTDIYGWQVVKSYDIGDVDLMVQHIKDCDPMLTEGRVVCDHRFHRIKIKGRQYVIMAHTSAKGSSFSDKDIISIIQRNEADEFLANYPEHLARFDQLTELYQRTLDTIQTSVNQHLNETPKEMGLIVKDLWYKSCLFALKNGKVTSVRDWLDTQDPKRLVTRLSN